MFLKFIISKVFVIVNKEYILYIVLFGFDPMHGMFRYIYLCYIEYYRFKVQLTQINIHVTS